MKQVRIVISGFVHGVGFRYFVREEADKSKITGWVRNTPNGTVEALLQGNDQKVQEIIELCHVGPLMAQVENVQEFPANEPIFQDFVIKN